MLNWLGLPVQASAHAAELDQMTALVALADARAVRRLGRVLPVRPRPVPQGRESDGELRGRERQAREVHRSAGRDHRDRAARLLCHPRLGDARRRRCRAKTRRSSSASSAEQFAWNVQYPGRDGRFGRVDIKLVSADNPLGLDRTDPNAKDDIATINQLNLPVDRPVLVQPLEQGRDSQLRPLRNAREAGRDSRDGNSGLVRSQSSRRLRDHLLAAVRPRSLPHARLRDDPEPGRLRHLDGGAGKRARGEKQAAEGRKAR